MSEENKEESQEQSCGCILTFTVDTFPSDEFKVSFAVNGAKYSDVKDSPNAVVQVVNNFIDKIQEESFIRCTLNDKICVLRTNFDRLTVLESHFVDLGADNA